MQFWEAGALPAERVRSDMVSHLPYLALSRAGLLTAAQASRLFAGASSGSHPKTLSQKTARETTPSIWCSWPVRDGHRIPPRATGLSRDYLKALRQFAVTTLVSNCASPEIGTASTIIDVSKSTPLG